MKTKILRTFSLLLILNLLSKTINAQQNYNQFRNSFYRVLDDSTKRDSAIFYAFGLKETAENEFGDTSDRFLNSLWRLGIAFYNNKQNENSRFWFLKCFNLAQKLNNDFIFTESVLCQYLIKIYLIRFSDKDSAILFADKFIQYNKNLNGEKSILFLNRVCDIAYEFEKASRIREAQNFYKIAIESRRKIFGKSYSDIILGMDSVLSKTLSKNIAWHRWIIYQSWYSELSIEKIDSISISESRKMNSWNYLYSSLAYIDKTIIQYGDTSSKFFKGLTHLSYAYQDFCKLDSVAIYCNKRGLSILDMQGKRGSYSYWDLVADQAFLYSHIMIYNRSISLGHYQLKLADSLSGKYSEIYSKALHILAKLYMASTSDHNYDSLKSSKKAKFYQNQAVELNKRLFGDTSLEFAMTLYNLAPIYMYCGELDSAELLYLKAYNLFSERQILHLYYFITEEISDVYFYMEETSKAMWWQNKYIELLEQRGDSLTDKYAYSLLHLLQSQLKINNSEKSNELILKIENIIDKRKIQNGSLERSLLIEKINYELLRENYNQLDTQLLFLINKYSDENLYDLKSKRHLRQISELYKDLAKIFVYQNKYHEARWANQISILKLLELNYDSTSQVIGGRFQQRGQIMYYLNQFDSALLFYNLCLNGLKSISGEKSIDYQEAKIEVATFYWNINKIEEAEQLMSEGCTKLKEFMVNNMSGFSEKQRQEYVNILSENMSKYYSLNHIYYNSNKGMATTAYNFILQSKGLNFNSTNYFNKLISSSGDTILNKRIQELKNMRKQLVIYYAKNIRHSSIDSLEDILTTSEQALTFDSPSFANFQKQNNATFDDVKKNLVPGEAAIEFISFPYYNKDIRTDSILLGAYVVTATSEQASYISLCNNSTLVNLLKAQGIAGRGTIKPNSKKLNETFKILYSKVWDPLENYLPGIKKIFIASDGLLNRLAFISLQDKNDKLIFDKYEVHFVLSTKDIAKVKASQKKFVKSSISLFGGANYSLVNKGALKDSLIGYRSLPLGMGGTSEWDFLPSTLTEVKNISKELKVNKWIVNSYIGNEASENNFKYQNGKNAPSLIHIATHGFYFPLIRRSNSINTLNSKFVYKESENPMLRSGLLFSSANEAWMGKTVKDDSEDGILTAFELANIDLSKTELIVLSACETGLGDVLNGEGVFGLQRAIKLAGVNKMIVSLWSVPDRETAEMMEEFYSALLKEKSIFKAFHFAQTVMRNRYPNKPVLWAGFILIE